MFNSILHVTRVNYCYIQSFAMEDEDNNRKLHFSKNPLLPRHMQHTNYLRNTISSYITEIISPEDDNSSLEHNIPFLLVHNLIEKRVYPLVDGHYTEKRHYNFYVTVTGGRHKVQYRKKDYLVYFFDFCKQFCFERFRKYIIFTVPASDPLNITPKEFIKCWNFSRKKLYCGGVILLNSHNQVLLVKSKNTSENKSETINFPMGKCDFFDYNSIKTTSLRELGEETGYWWNVSDFQDIHIYQKIPFNVKLGSELFPKPLYFFFFENFNRHINPYHKAPGEIIGNMWVNVNALNAFINKKPQNAPINKCKPLYNFRYHNSTYTVASSVNEFFSSENDLKKYLLRKSKSQVSIDDYKFENDRSKATLDYTNAMNAANAAKRK